MRRTCPWPGHGLKRTYNEEGKRNRMDLLFDLIGGLSENFCGILKASAIDLFFLSIIAVIKGFSAIVVLTAEL